MSVWWKVLACLVVIRGVVICIAVVDGLRTQAYKRERVDWFAWVMGSYEAICTLGAIALMVFG